MFDTETSSETGRLDSLTDVRLSGVVFEMLAECFALAADDGGVVVDFVAYVGGVPVDMSADVLGVCRDGAGGALLTVSMGAYDAESRSTIPASAVQGWDRS